MVVIEAESESEIGTRWHEVLGEVARHCIHLGREPESCRIIAVSKTRSAEEVSLAAAAGITDFGENRVQEAEPKIGQIDPRPTWHLVGHLQTNKAARAARLFDCVQSVDSVRLAKALGQGAEEAGRDVIVLVQVNLTGESQKTGCPPADLEAVIESVQTQRRLVLRGLMTIGPISQSEDETKRVFSAASELRGLWRQKLQENHMDVLSMGMSGDWRWALECGADWLRIGTAIFGSRT
jgi:pyridoxal phosphate enzyme (YggS family)